ncbi:otoancorin [Synchiropus splendidus]|uniref:otoancorin n=1 Tax=Synchiropus splendidus TaxID=270530 RepID=UPI00237D4289|nr:otoancorin [Synchiropus splendidus]XP_053699568.1 otoancorin [Synchiropus splendidus]XP_053699569.1 otoancorin [Synchiropus splendidus]XP_053699570.1 otoancorin [Synchiropus splendidus]
MAATSFSHLIVVCTIFAQVQSQMPGNKDSHKKMVHKLMRDCEKKGFPLPSVHDDGPEGREQPLDKRNTLLSAFSKALETLSRGEEDPEQPLNPLGENQTMNCVDLLSMIKAMKRSSDGPACYMKAFVAPCSVEVLTTQMENMDPEEYGALLQAAKSAMSTLPTRGMKLLKSVGRKDLKEIAKRLKDIYESMTDDQRALVVAWEREQVSQNYFNCTQDQQSTSVEVKRCKASLPWLDSETMEMMGPFLSYLSAADVDSSPKQMLCEFFLSSKSMASMSAGTMFQASLGKRFMQRFQECFSEKELAEHLDKLGPLACYYEDFPDLPVEASEKLLSQLDSCDDPRITKERKRLLDSVMSQSNWTYAEAVQKLNASATLVPPDKLSQLHPSTLKEIIRKVGFLGHWSKAQKSALLDQLLGKDKCETDAGDEVLELGPIIESVPRCVLKHIKPTEILKDREKLEKISRRMTTGQLKATLLRLREEEDYSSLMEKLPGRLLQSVSLIQLEKVKDLTPEAADSPDWTRPQAAFLVKRLLALKKLPFGKLRSLIQGVTCRMLSVASERELQLVAQDIEESPQWVSKKLARCAALKYLAILEQRENMNVSSITAEELDNIPEDYVIFLPSSRLKELPDSVCPVFLDKMEAANVDLLPRRAPSRRALLQGALDCLGPDLSKLTVDDVSRLGLLICDLEPSEQMSQMSPEVVKHTLQLMASCEPVPSSRRPPLMRLVRKALGNPSHWSEDTVERFGLLLYWDDDAVAALPNEPWLRRALRYLRRRSRLKPSEAMEKKRFDLATRVSSSQKRRKRGVDPRVPTVELVQELELANIHWTPQQLAQMSSQTFWQTIEIFGNIVGYTKDQLAKLCEKSVQAFGPPQQMNDQSILQLGCISRCFSNRDLEQMAFSLDMLEPLAQCGWSESQMASVWTAVSGNEHMETLQEMGAAEMSSLSQFICGLKAEQIKQLNVDTFRDAVNSISNVQCSADIGQQLKDLAIRAFGPPKSWTEARVAELGNIIAWLNGEEMLSLHPQVFSFIHQATIPLISPQSFAQLTVEQIKELGPDNTAMVTSAQRAAMSRKQVEALEGVERDASLTAENSREQSGAGSVWADWTSIVMKSLLAFLAGFLLV